MTCRCVNGSGGLESVMLDGDRSAFVDGGEVIDVDGEEGIISSKDLSIYLSYSADV